MQKQHVIQLVVVLIFFGFSALKWVFAKLQQQAALRKLETEREMRRLEALRTGKTVEEQERRPQTEQRRAGPNSAQVQELARRRAAQLEELRRVQAAQRGQIVARASSPTGRPITSIPGSTGPIVPGTRRQSSPTPVQRPTRSDRTRAERESKRAASQQPQIIAPAPRPAAQAQPSAYSKPEQSRTAARAISGTLLARMSTAELRRAFIVTEILGRPVSQRDMP